MESAESYQLALDTAESAQLTMGALLESSAAVAVGGSGPPSSPADAPPAADSGDEMAPRLSEPEDALTPFYRTLLEKVRRARAEARELRGDQIAFSNLAEGLLLGTVQRRPAQCCRVLDAAEIPGGALSPFQAQSLADFCQLDSGVLPTHEAVRRHCKAQLLNLQGASRDAEAARLFSETLSRRPSANDPQAMCSAAAKDGGHPLGGAPRAPPDTYPPRMLVEGDVLPVVDVGALCRLHASAGSGCNECARREPCWIHTAGKILANADLLADEGFAAAQLQRTPMELQPEINPALVSKVEKLLRQHVVEPAEPGPGGSIDHFSTIFLAVAGREAVLSDALAATLAEGGEASSRAAASEAARLAHALVSGYSASPTDTAPSRRAAWEAAEARIFTEGKLRAVVDLSPLNAFAPQLRMRYPELWEALASTKKGFFCVRLDVASGFYHISLSERSRRLTGFSVRWHDGSVRHFRFNRLVMGGRVSPWIFSLLTAVILSILRSMGFADISLVFVDDFLIFAPTAAECERALQALMLILAGLNIRFAVDKTSTRALPVDVLLGLQCDLHKQTLALPPSKLVRLLARAGALEALAAAGKPFPAFVLASVAGGVCNLARVDECVAAGARALASYYDGHGGRLGWARFKASAHTATPAEAQALTWLRQWAEAGLLRPVRFLPDGAQRPVIDFTSDASGSNALGIATQATRLRVVLPDCANLGIPTMEQLGRPVFLQEYGFLAPGFHFRHGCDSMPVCFREVKGSARDGVDNDLCAVTSVAMRHADQGGSTHFASRYVNGISDRLSAEAVAALERRGYLQPGEAVEVTYRGHPPQFLSALKRAAPSSLPWRAPSEWAQVTKRE